jgi:hypothetical protein
VWTECDHPADGVLQIWEAMADEHPERVTVNPSPGAFSAPIAERVSASLLARYVELERAYRAHRVAAHKDENDCPPCEDCEVGMDLFVLAKILLEYAWGYRVLDASIEAAYGSG